MMIKGVNFIGSTPSHKSDNFLQAVNPENGTSLPEKFFIANEEEVRLAVNKAAEAFQAYKHVSGSDKARFLDAIADEVMALGDELIERAGQESGLPAGRLEGERGRTVNQIKMFADLLREGSWVDARIDTEQSDIRTMSYPLGPVVVFGASNFPFAFSTAGGDTASALAAGCPVVVKSHESHPGTNELVARAILKAAEATGMPDGVFSSLNGGPDVGKALVSHPQTCAVGFTGSYGAGTSIFQLANQREVPIPVYSEMGSINPVFLLEQKLKSEAEELASQYAGSVTLGAGQFCTKPGLIIGIEGDGLDRFTRSLSTALQEVDPACMLNEGIASTYLKKRKELLSQHGVETVWISDSTGGNLGHPTLARVSSTDFLSNRTLSEEVFGPFTLIVSCKDSDELEKVARSLQGQLTLTFMATDEELADSKSLISICREKAGRVIFNGVPTGVAVCAAMQHGGPFPATTDSKFTSVGSTAIRRFIRPIAFQSFPQTLLPEELRDGNPLGIMRLINGEYTRE
ncbi:MAG: aldehyde dehydrogenase (NADP(+)) [Balneolaceae bacterium]